MPTKSTLIQTKLQPPSTAPDILPRARLLDRLNEGLQRPLTLISASAGCGKSTLASRWAAACDCPSGWVSLDEGDNDPRLFLSYLLAALRSLHPQIEFRTEMILEADKLPAPDELAHHLLNDLHQLTEPFILILDDYHHITETTVHDLVQAILAYPPRAMHLVLVTRSDPPLSIATLRGRGLMTEVRTADLRFTPAEADAFLTGMLNISLDDATVELLGKKTEGWAAGLRLTGLYLRGRDDIGKSVRDLSGSSQYIAEYLMAEVLSLQPPEMTDYFIETSILERFCAPMLEAMHLREAGEKKEPAAITAEQFIRCSFEANLFIVSLDDQGRWFRLHHLFQDFLKSLLRKRRTADQIAGLHRRASEWFAENGLIEEAIQHALAAGDNEFAVRQVLEHRYDLMNNARYHLLNKWVAKLPRNVVAETPLLVTTRAITAWVYGQREDVAILTEQAKQLLDTLSPESSEYSILRGEIITLHNVISALYNKPVKTWLDPIKALELLPKKALFYRLLAIGEMAFRSQMKGDLNQGVKLLKEELKTADLPFSIQARGWFYLCVVNYLDCNTSGILLSGFKSLEIVGNHRLAHTRGVVKYFIGATHYLRNELTKAKTYLKGVLDDHAFTNAIYVAQTSGILGFIYLSEGRPEKAESVIEQTVDSAWKMQDSHSPAIREALRVELALRRGMVDEARRLSIDTDFDLLPPTWFIYVPQFTNIKLLLADGTDRSLEDARSRLVEMDQTMRSINRKCLRIDLLALLALVCHEMGEEKAALAKLQAALDLAEPGGWIRNFVDLGTPMAGLLKRLIEVEPGRTHAKKIINAFRAECQADPSPSPDANTVADSALKVLASPLTPRETELVSLLAAGLSNKEIAVKLHIATETVKTHLQNLYKKLDARGRLAAVHAARTLGLIPKD